MTPIDPVDEPLDGPLLDAARGYNRPPDAVPREAMWASIQTARRGRSPIHAGRRRSAPVPSHRRPTRLLIGWPLAAAAAATVILTSGVVIGRWARDQQLAASRPGPQGAIPAIDSITGTRTPAAPQAAYDIAVTRDLTQAEALLTAYRAGRSPVRDQGQGRDADALVASWAREVLSNTRLLLDSPAGAEPQRRRLLEDLEVVLVQIVASAPTNPQAEREMIDSTLQHQHVMTRLRSAVPAGGIGI
jgi:hypothetical protein